MPGQGLTLKMASVARNSTLENDLGIHSKELSKRHST